MLKNGYFKSFLFFMTFLIIYISNFFLPFSRLYPYADIDTLSAYDTRPWNWTISVFLILAILFILKYRKFSMTYLSYALVLGILSGCGKYIWFDANLLLLCKDMIEVSIIFYSACLIYEALPYLQSKVDFLPLKILKSFVFGVVVSIPFAIINVIYFSMSAPININSFFSSFIEAFQPALAEEIPFRFFCTEYFVIS